jgi:ABC-2 type transport system ATP-binding protein
VRGVSFEVSAGEVVGFLGPNGAGKTTTMRMLVGYIPPSSGTARLAGFDVGRDSLEVRRRVGYLPENAPLYNDMAVDDFLDTIADIRQIEKSRKRARLEATIDECGLGRVLKKDIGELSRGFRQRVGLAAALLHAPDVMILDEPTSGLDPNQITEIRDLIRQIGREKTILLSTHILPEVSATCGRVLIINDGQIVASGTPDELTSRVGGGEAVIVAVRAARDDVRRRLGARAGVRDVRILGEEGGVTRASVLAAGDGHSGDALAEDVFRCAVEAGWVLSELRTERASLEEVFRSLTMGEREEAAS